ncbi:MAG: hypothetical protein P4L39_01480 [Humidesulfovibrio sp.]|nr:hypothetical protein [Humidesulfovibrio sp.]
MHALNKGLSWRAAPLIPPLILAACLGLWAVDTLNWDEWLIWTDMLRKLHAGSLGLADIILQNNEQRSAIVRVLGLAFFPWFRLARWPELFAIVLMAGGGVLLAWRLMRLSGWRADDRRPLALFSLLGFSLIQWETFSVGINTSVILPSLTLWAGVCLAWSGTRLGPGRLLGLALVGLPASFSFANGLFYWPCLAPLIALRMETRRRGVLVTGLWLALGALVWLGYFAGYVKPGQHPSILLALRAPHMLLGYFATYLGGALAGDRHLQPLAMLAGGFALAALAALALSAWRAGGAERRALAPWLCMAAFTLLTAAATAAARGGFGLGQAQESRYATFSSPLWMTLCALAFLGWEHLSERARRWLFRGFALCGALFALSSVLAAVVLHNRAPRLELARQELYRLTQPENLREIFPDPAFVIASTPLFVAMRAGAQRILPQPEALVQGEPTQGSAFVEPHAELDGRVPGFLLRGSAPGHAGAWLVVRAATRTAALGKIEADGTFALFLPENALPAGRQTLASAVLAQDGRTLHAIGPAKGLGVDNPGRTVARFDLASHFYVPGLTDKTGSAAVLQGDTDTR